MCIYCCSNSSAVSTCKFQHVYNNDWGNIYVRLVYTINYYYIHFLSETGKFACYFKAKILITNAQVAGEVGWTHYGFPCRIQYTLIHRIFVIWLLKHNLILIIDKYHIFRYESLVQEKMVMRNQVLLLWSTIGLDMN